MNNCVNYDISIFDYIFPQMSIFWKLCISYDKTKLFLATTIRLLVYIGILLLLNYYLFDSTKNKNLTTITFNKLNLNIDTNLMKTILYSIIGLSILSLLIILFKLPKYKTHTNKKYIN